MNRIFKTICCLVVFTFSAIAQNDITVVVSNLESNDGKVFVGLYNTEESFLGKGFKHVNSKIEDNSCTVVFENVPNGIYAISLFHDENGNDKMDTGMFGIPKEAYGCSNNATGFMGPPKWEDAKFEVKNKSVRQNINL